MRQDATLLRPARPDISEGLQFARYMDQAADGFFRFMLGKSAERIIARAFPEPQHSFSYEHVTFAERAGELVGMSSAYTGEQHRGFSEEPLERAAGRSAFRFKCLRTLLAPLWRILDTVAEGDFYLQGIAVEPDLRGGGIGSLLMTDIEQRARASGSARLCLDVAARNTRAGKLYARRGMVESSRWPSFGILPPLFVRMTKVL